VRRATLGTPRNDARFAPRYVAVILHGAAALEPLAQCAQEQEKRSQALLAVDDLEMALLLRGLRPAPCR
jgi:hypothetical protein